ADVMSRRHAEYFVELAEHAEPELRLAQQWQWFHLLETEYDNLRAVLRWSLDEGDSVLGVRLAGALGLFWYACGYHAEGRQWSDRLLERLDAVPTRYHTNCSSPPVTWRYCTISMRQWSILTAHSRSRVR